MRDVPPPGPAPTGAIGAMYDEALSGFLTDRGWQRRSCARCARTFFAKTAAPTCGDAACAGRFCYPAFSKPRRYTTRDELWARASAFVLARGFARAEAVSVVNAAGDTLFIGAGLQYVTDMLDGRRAPSPDPVFLGQPSIRLNALSDVGAPDGRLSSFVNLCTEQLHGTFADYCRHVDTWLALLSAVGLYAADLTLIVESPAAEPTHFVDGRILSFNYGGIEVGEAILAAFARPAAGASEAGAPAIGAPAVVVDCGFGLERLHWAVNKSASFYLLIGPIADAVAGRHVLLDAVRTLTLVALSGVTPSNRAHGYRLRQLARLVARERPGEALHRLVRHSYDEWGRYMPPARPLAAAYEVIRREVARNTNAAVRDQLGLPANAAGADLDPDAFHERLLRGGMHPEVLRSALTASEPGAPPH